MAGNTAVLHFAGFEGIFCGASAIYLAMAEVLNEQYGRTMLPIGEPHGHALNAVTAGHNSPLHDLKRPRLCGAFGFYIPRVVSI